jgi:hypothetical protein
MIEINTIYDYYEKIDDRYFVARIFGEGKDIKVKHYWNPLAKKVTVSGFTGFDLFIYCEDKRLLLCEGITGAVILRQCDLESRIMRRANIKLFTGCLPAELNKLGGTAMINQLIVNFIMDYNQKISPRYKTKNI